MKFIEEKKDSWEEYLDTCVYAYNTACHESTQYTPFELMFARKALLPIDIEMEKKDAGLLLDEYNKADDYPISEAREEHQKLLEAAKDNITKAQRKQKQHYDKRHFKPGELNSMHYNHMCSLLFILFVYIYTHRKLCSWRKNAC